MSCFSRASQAVLPNRDRNEQVNRVVNRTYVNKVCIFYFFYYFILKELFMGKYMELCILCFLGVENIM